MTNNKRPQISVPDDFPRFIVPGLQKELDGLRELYWTHYERSTPTATFEDDWLPKPQLWPATNHENRMNNIRRLWRESLINKGMDDEGYVFTHQHLSIAHQHGWPFPFWREDYPGTWGWHFNFKDVGEGWYYASEKTQEGFVTHGVDDLGIIDGYWNFNLNAADAWIEPPELYIDPAQCPFIQIRWCADKLDGAQPYIQWATAESPEFDAKRRMFFDISPDKVDKHNKTGHTTEMTYTQIPMYKNRLWNDSKKITRLRICFNNLTSGQAIKISSVFTAFDTRHTINNAYYLSACVSYYEWTGDIAFLRQNINRMRIAMRWMMTVCKGLEEKCIVAPFVGHDGRPGYTVNADGTKAIHPAQGIGSNYWDIIPAGYKDAYATIQYHSALKKIGGLEKDIADHPEWNIPEGTLVLDGGFLINHAAEVREYGTKAFWNPVTKRYTTGLDADGKSYDYGFTFMNLEAMYYGFATEEQCKDIYSWLNGERIVDGDTSQGKDIYHWRFGPRSTTKRNIEYYAAGWTGPETIPWGYQVQDGGCVLGFSLFDLTGRLKIFGADNAWERLAEIMKWYSEVMEEGGPREYYKDGTRGTMQGCGTAGGLGIDLEFLESILVPQIMIHGFMGLNANGGGITINPRLPDAFPSLEITRIHYRSMIFDVTAEAKNKQITVKIYEGRVEDINFVTDEKSGWRLTVRKL